MITIQNYRFIAILLGVLHNSDSTTLKKVNENSETNMYTKYPKTS